MDRPDPGWYPDPEQPGQVRYFDGATWTTHVRDVAPSDTAPGGPPPGDAPVAGAASPEPSDDPPTSRNLLLLFGAALMVLVLAGTLFLGNLGGDGDDAATTDPADDGAFAQPDGESPDDDVIADEPGDGAEETPDDADGPGDADADAPDAEPDDDAGPEPLPSEEGYDAPFEMTIDPAASYLATIATSEGDIALELDPVGSPVTTNNLVNLARDGYYDGVIFHRVIEGFVIQGGDPTGTGAGGPGYRFEDELATAEELVAAEGGYPRGTLAMANAGPNTNGSQFFIVHADLVQLPPDYTVFGRVTDGLDVLDAIAAIPTDSADRPTTDVTITTIEITEQ